MLFFPPIKLPSHLLVLYPLHSILFLFEFFGTELQCRLSNNLEKHVQSKVHPSIYIRSLSLCLREKEKKKNRKKRRERWGEEKEKGREKDWPRCQTAFSSLPSSLLCLPFCSSSLPLSSQTKTLPSPPSQVECLTKNHKNYDGKNKIQITSLSRKFFSRWCSLPKLVSQSFGFDRERKREERSKQQTFSFFLPSPALFLFFLLFKIRNKDQRENSGHPMHPHIYHQKKKKKPYISYNSPVPRSLPLIH